MEWSAARTFREAKHRLDDPFREDRPMLRFCTLLLALAAAGGCAYQPAAGTAADVRLHVQPRPAAPGDSLVLVLENASAEPIGYNLCASGLEQRAGDAWRAVREERVCTMELRMLEPGQQARFAFLPPPGLAPGEYRAVTAIERQGAAGLESLASTPFSIAR
jgi:hypothetical protein